MTTHFLALPLWRYLTRNRATSHNEIPSVMGEEYVIYLDQDNILLPTIPPPAYAIDDPNPASTRARRPVAVLAVIESVERTEDDGAGNIRRTTLRAVGDGDERRVSITLKGRGREFELSLKAVLSVIVFLLAIIVIAWLGSVAVTYTWPPKGTSPKEIFEEEELSLKIERLADNAVKEYFKTEDVAWPLVGHRIPAHTTLDEGQRRETAMKSMESRNGELIASLSSYSSKSLASSVSEASSSSSAFEYNAWRAALSVSASSSSLSAASASSLSPRTPLPSSIFEPSVLPKLQAEIGNRPIYNCFHRPGWSDGPRRNEDRDTEKRIYDATGEVLK